jgi:hypothetical protein
MRDVTVVGLLFMRQCRACTCRVRVLPLQNRVDWLDRPPSTSSSPQQTHIALPVSRRGWPVVDPSASSRQRVTPPHPVNAGSVHVVVLDVTVWVRGGAAVVVTVVSVLPDTPTLSQQQRTCAVVCPKSGGGVAAQTPRAHPATQFERKGVAKSWPLPSNCPGSRHVNA